MAKDIRSLSYRDGDRVLPRRPAADRLVEKTTQASVSKKLCPQGHAEPSKFGNCTRCGAKIA